LNCEDQLFETKVYPSVEKNTPLPKTKATGISDNTKITESGKGVFSSQKAY